MWVRDQARLVRDESGNASTWQGIMLDITSQKDLEERLRRSNDDLEFRVLQRTSELEEANEMMSLEIGERKRIESELRETQEQYRRLVEDLPAVVYMWQVHDVGISHVYTSPRIEKLLGYSAEEWNTSDAWKDRLHPHDRERVLAATARSETTGEPFSEEYRVFAKDGRLVVVFDHATLLSRDDQGRPQLFQGVLMDMTDRHRAQAFAERSAERYREIAEDEPRRLLGDGDRPGHRTRPRSRAPTAIHQPADPGHPRVPGGTVLRRRVELAQHRAPRRPRHGRGDQSARRSMGNRGTSTTG